MKKVVLAVFSVLSMATVAFSQQERGGPQDFHHNPQDRQDHMEHIHALKVAFITDKLHFSSEQSARFWPMYDDYEQETFNIRKSFFQKYNADNSSDGNIREARQYIEDDLDYQEQIIQLKRKYNAQFLKVISTQQVAQLYRAEREFKQMLIQQLRERHGGGGGWDGGGGR